MKFHTMFRCQNYNFVHLFTNQENVLHFAQNIHEMKNSWRFFLFFRMYYIFSVSYQFFPAFDLQNVSKNISCLTSLLMQGLNFFCLDSLKA